MFHHVKDLQFNARVSKPDPRFANLLLEQFGGGNGELKAAMQYFTQAFGVRQTHPDKYDLLMDIATEEFSHLEIVGATIQMLLSGVSGELKQVAESSEIMHLLDGKTAKEGFIHDAIVNPHFFNLTGGGPEVTDSRGIPWSGAYVNAVGDLTVDLRSNIGAESRAKIVYEYLMKFTDDAYVKETLRFLMTREVAHFQMFEAALNTIQPNFPPGVLQTDPRHSNTYYNMSKGNDAKGPWNEGKSTQFKEDWEFIDDPQAKVKETNGLLEKAIVGSPRTLDGVEKKNEALAAEKSAEIAEATPKGFNQWSDYGRPPQDGTEGFHLKAEKVKATKSSSDKKPGTKK